MNDPETARKMRELHDEMPRIHRQRKTGTFSYRDLGNLSNKKWHHTTIMRHYRKWLASQSFWWKVKEFFGWN